MADKAIYELTEATEVKNEDTFVLEQDGTAKKLSGHTLGDYVYAAAAEKIAEVEQAVADAQTAVNNLEAQKDTIAQTIASMADLGTDTTLSTAGMAADAAAAGNKINDLESTFNILGIIPETLNVQDGKYYPLGDGSVNIDQPIQLRDYECAVIPCAAGDVFYVSSKGQTRSRAWGYVDASGNVTRSAAANITAENNYTVAYPNSAYLILNNLKSGNINMSARKVSAKYLPLAFTGDKKLYNGFDLNTLTVSGSYYIQDAMDAINKPLATVGKIIVFVARQGNVVQMFLTVSGSLYIRSNFDNPNWNEWVKVADANDVKNAITSTITEATEIPGGSDLNDYRDNGNYYINNTDTISNIPAKIKGLLYVLIPASNWRVQWFISSAGYQYTRWISPGLNIWSEWIRFASINETVNNTKDITIPNDVSINQNKYLIFANNIVSLGDSELWDTTGFISVNNVDLSYFVYQKTRIVDYNAQQEALSLIDVQDMSVIQFSSETKYIRLSYYKPETRREEVALLGLDANAKKAISAVYNALDNSGLSYARHNAIASANQLAKIEWTPIRAIPVTNSAGYVAAGTKCVGLPYSSTRSVCKYIGQHLSIYTFMSALQNPKSVLYTRRIKYGTLGKTYYGITCFTFTSYSAGSQLGTFDNEISRMFDGSNIEISPYEIQPGDSLQLTYDRETLPAPDLPQPYQHCILVYDVFKDYFGRIRTVQLAEAESPFTIIHNPISFDQFITQYITGGRKYKYKVYRKNGRIDYGAYKAVDEVKGYSDEEPSEVVYPDIMPEYGDKACIEDMQDVTINVVNRKAYTRIEVYKNGDLIDTKSNIDDFTINSIKHGTYEFVITDGTDSSTSRLIVADINGSYNPDTKIITFSSTNSTPVFAASYITDSNLKGVQNKVKYFTPEEQQQGWANVSDIVGQYYDAVQIGFLTEYGVAMWWSQKLTDEWEYWTPPST